jgi:hypothetical protein
MKHYLLSDQDLKEILWELENLAWQLEEKIRDRFINEADPNEEEES